MHVGDMDSVRQNNGRTWSLVLTISVADAGHNPVENAAVNGFWSAGASGTNSCITNASGTCTIILSGILKKTGTVTFNVDTVVHASLTYEMLNNHDPDGDSDGTVIVILKP